MEEKYEYNDFKYNVDYTHPEPNVEITHNKRSPSSLYKFYSINKFSIDALLNSYLYASHPFELNDILDSSPFLLYTSKPLDLERYIDLYGSLHSKEAILEIWKDDSTVEKKCRQYLLHMYAISFNLIGIISLTSKENNILMWPHYAQERGFQIKFNTSKLISSISNKLEKENGEFLGFNPINYCEKLNPIDVYPYKTLFIPISYVTNIKSNKWEYEDEWRILVSKNNMGVPHSKSGLNIIPDHLGNKENRKTNYDFNDIEEICLGFNFFIARDFNITKLDNNTAFSVQPLNGIDFYNYENYIQFLDFISEQLSDKFYYSGIKYEMDDQGKLFLIRTKEKLQIEKIGIDVYKIIRTNDIIRLFD